MDTEKLNQLKILAKNAVKRKQDNMRILAHTLHTHPELAMQEHQAVAWLSEELEQNGFTVERGICGLPTAFRATYGAGKPVIAFLAEYDALPELGHACGHNLIATGAVTAAIGAKPGVDALGGTIQVIGTPAEEMQGGKIIMAARGAFDGLDAALMMHPAVYDSATVTALACVALDVEFFGKEAHAAAHPDLGINALEAMILSFNAINALRQHIHAAERVHGVITDGGRAANIVPAHSAARFLVRAPTEVGLNQLRERVLSCFKAAAEATGARLEARWAESEYYRPMRNNLTMARLYVQNMELVAVRVPLLEREAAFGSTDMGNVSQMVPAIHTAVSISEPGSSEHTAEFARCADTERGLMHTIKAATGLAMTAIDLLASPETLAAIRQEFERG
jgi:amidohydrolase